MNVQDLIQAAALKDATVEQDEGGSAGWVTYQVLAPEGQLWVDGGCTALRVEWSTHGKYGKFRDDALSEAIERIALGTYDDEEFA